MKEIVYKNSVETDFFLVTGEKQREVASAERTAQAPAITAHPVELLGLCKKCFADGYQTLLRARVAMGHAHFQCNDHEQPISENVQVNKVRLT